MSIAVGMGSNKKEVPLQTKRAMRAAHLLGRILKEHFDNNLCEYMTEKSFDWRSYSLNILDNLLLVGGIPRDILLGTEVKDIDITFNLRELTKIQLNHLRKYHSKKSQQSVNCKCAYWQHYLNKYSPENEEEEKKNQSEKNQIIRFHNCSYIFNARYFIDILQESPYLKNKVSIKDIPKHGFISCTIIDNIEHESYDLKGQKFEFTDTFDSIQVLSVQKLLQQDTLIQQQQEIAMNGDEQKVNGSPKKSRWKSIALFPQAAIDSLADEFDQDIKLVDIEIYPIKVRTKLSCYDFSINTAIIPLSSITEFCDSEDEVNIAIWFWEYIVENGLDDIDAIRDITIHRILRVPQPFKDLYIIRIHPTTYHFWRTIELMIRLPNFYIDDNLIKAHIEDYDGWLNITYFNENKNRRKFIEKFIEIVKIYCKNISDVRSMLHTLEILQFNQRFTSILYEIKELNSQLMQAIQSMENQQILVIFSSYGYPFLYGLTPPNQQNQNINTNNNNNHQKESEQQKKEILRLNNINKQLSNENVSLKQEIGQLKEAKTILAINSAKAIDELRGYLLKYQEPLNDSTQ